MWCIARGQASKTHGWSKFDCSFHELRSVTFHALFLYRPEFAYSQTHFFLGSQPTRDRLLH